MIRPVWQLRPSSSAGRQEDNCVTNSHAVQDEGDNKDSQERGGGATRKSKWKIYKNPRLRRGFQYLKNYRRSATEPLRINRENPGECDNSDPLKKIPKSDKNWIRIQVTYDDNEKHCLDSVNKNSSVSEVVVNYNPNDSGERRYNEKAVDVPEEYVVEKHFSTRRDSERWSQNKRSLNETVQDFLREDWIDNEYADNYCHRHTLTGYNSILDNKDIYLSRNYFIKPTYFNQQTMGINCSTKLGKLRKHSVVPADSGVIVYEKSTTEDNRQRDATKLNSPKRLTNTAHNRNPIPAFKVKSPPSYRELFSVEESTSPCTSSTIEWDNILHRRNDINSPIPNPKLITSAKVQNSSKTAIEKISSPVPTPVETKQKSPFGSAFLRNFGGSYQNLVKVSKGDRIKSASENNLMKVSNAQMSKPVTKCSSTLSTDYCPSVLYSRKQIADKATSNEWKSNLKNFKEKLFAMHLPKRKKSKEENRARSPIQDLDGGFFEKFGSLLRQKSQMEETRLSTPLAPLPEEEDITVDAVTNLCSARELENDSGTETLPESDNEVEETRAKHESFIEGAVGMNIDELYEEVLYEILHNLGCEASEDVCQSSLFEYVQDAFKISNEKHEEIFEAASQKEPPEVRLNVEVIKADNLEPKDSNGFSDPFVTLYLESHSSHRYNTSVKSATLSPLWEEHFSLPIPENPNTEILIIEVWDFDAAETVGEKMNKIFEVKGVKGLRKLMKEIAVTASTGKHDNELIGRASVSLKTIPASGIKVWYTLEKGNKQRSRGSVLVRMNFSAEKNNRVAAQEHRHLLRILLMHELESSKVAHYWWNGKFSEQGEAVLTQHSAQSALSPMDRSLAQWSVFAQIHQDHPLAFMLFNTLLDKIIPVIQTLPESDDEVKFFWEGSKRLLPSCFSVIRKLRKKTCGDKASVKMLSETLDIISKIAMLEPPEGTDLLPKQIYGWVTREEDGPNWDIRGAVRDAVHSGATEWFEHINEGNEYKDASDEDRLQNLIKLIQLIRSDLQRSIEYYDKHFQQKMHFSYAKTLYLFYQKKLAEVIQPVVEDVCKNIKRLSITEERFERLPEHQEINMGTTLFELYLVLKRFTTLGTALCPGEEDMEIHKYHEWFTPGVTHWLDISVYKALIRIEKAIDLDKLRPVDETVKYSSSAVDTLAIFYQIKIFWQQLAWPDAEGAYMFVGKIVDDICRCCVFYADRMAKRVEEFHMYEDQQRFEVTSEWCLAINNIDYIRQSLSPFIKELGVDEIINKIAEYRSSLEADRCAATLTNVIENAIDTEKNKILELIEVVANKMSPAMRRFLIEGAEVLHEDSNSMDRLMMYLEESLATLHTELNEVNFERILDSIWVELSAILYELVQSNLDKRRPPAFFKNLRDTLHIMVSCFKLQSSGDRSSSYKDTLENIERILELHAYETGDLIHQYYLERLEDQHKMKESVYGQLTVRGHFDGYTLALEIMNGRNLVPMDSNGSCDSFVKVHFMPADKFLGVTSPKTNTQHKTLFPLYDEKFYINLTDEQRHMGNALLIFSVKDKDLFGMSNQYIAECYLTFKEIEESDNEQIQLTLTRPIYKDTDCLQALEYRQGDKQAREFIKKLKQKAY